MHRNYFLSRPY